MAAPQVMNWRLPPRTILVVDDARDAAYLLGKLLETMGQTVHTANSGATAVRIAGSIRPDVVISDIGMPEMNGYELARLIRLDPAVKGTTLVALTGYGQETDKESAHEAGFDFHLTKPVSLEALHGLLSTLQKSVGP